MQRVIDGYLNMSEKRRYTSFQSNRIDTEPVVTKTAGSDDVIGGVIRDVLSNVENIHHLYDVEDFIITDQTFIDDPLIANVVKTSSFPNKLVLTIYDGNGTVNRHYVTNGTSVHLVKQKDSFHNRIILMVNEHLQKRGLDSLYVVNDLTRSNLNEININMIQSLERL